MTTNKTYRQIVGSTPDDLPQLVLSIVRSHIGGNHRITRFALVTLVKARLYPSINPESSDPCVVTVDRQVRRAIDQLQEMGYPILSDSGAGGYWMAASIAERQDYIAEIESRANKLISKARKLRTANRTDWQDQENIAQPALF